MRKNRFNRLLAGTALAAAIATPTMSPAAPDRIESVRPPPPSVNGQVIRHRAPPTQTPPNIIPVRRETAPVAAPAPQPVPPAPVVQQLSLIHI